MQLKALSEGEALSGNLNSIVLQLINGVTKLRMAAAEHRAFVVWAKNFAELRGRMLRVRNLGNTYSVFLSGYEVLSLTAIFAMIALALRQSLETGAFLAFISAFTAFLTSTSQVSRAVVQCFALAPMARRIAPLLNTLPEVDATKAHPGRLGGGIEVNNVLFRYERESRRVLNGLSMRVKPGEFVAIVGPSGCGKSTLMRLLLGFERPEAGTIFIDGHDLRTLDIRAVRQQIGVVLQSGRLMPGSLFENIRGATAATVEDAWNAVRMVGLDADIQQMPMGMHTVLTEGAALSGGQIQRVLIARALVGQPRILLFDEATSALDNNAQRIVTESLARLSVTRMAIAHRLSTVKNADRIFVVDAGRIVEVGTFAELMESKGLFAELARRQTV